MEYLPFINVLQKGIEQKILKNVDMNILSAFLFNPISRLANPRLCHGLDMNAGKNGISVSQGGEHALQKSA
jgi:hypothetical protein